MGSAVNRFAPYLTVVLVTILALANTYGLWQADLSLPIQVGAGDASVALYIVKAIGENAFPHNGRVGAPFGLDYNDMYQPDILHFWILKGMVGITGNALLSLNLYFLLGFVLVALSAFYVLRRFGLSILTSLVCAELYAFTPSHLWRSISHIFLSEYYLLPLVVLFCVQLMIDLPEDPDTSKSLNGPGQGSLQREHVSRKQSLTLLVFGIPLAVLVGIGGVYYAFYSVLFLCTASFYAAFRPGRRRYSAIGFACAALIVSTMALGMLPIVRYKQKYGPNLQVVARSFVDTEVYSLKITDLYLPVPFHPVKELRDLTARYNTGLPTMNENESEFSSLGVLGAVGFTALLLWPLLGYANERKDAVVMRVLIPLNLVAVLYAATAGFGTLFSFLVAPEIRCNTRLIFFIAFFSLAAFGHLLDSASRKLPRFGIVQVFSSGVIIFFLLGGLYDEGVTQIRPDRSSLKSAYQADDQFIKQIERQYSPGAKVLQLPYQSFPETEGPYHLVSYEPLRAYLHSSRLTWSYPAMRGRPADNWIRAISSAPPAELVKRAVASNFCGIYIDRNGYPDAAVSLETQLRSILGTVPIVSSSGELSFFSLAAYSDSLKQKTSASDWRQLTSEAQTLPKLVLAPLSGIYEPDPIGGVNWRWCSQKGVIGISNLLDRPVSATLTARLISGNSLTPVISFQTSMQQFSAKAPPTGNNVRWDLTLKPGMNQISFTSDAIRVVAPNDPRILYFRMDDLKISSR